MTPDPPPDGRPTRKIFHVAAPGRFGGLEQVVETLAAGQRGAGYDARVALFVQADEPAPGLVSALRASGVPLYIIATTPRAYLRQLRELRALLRAERPDVVHTHGYVGDVLTRLVRPSSQVCVATVHGFTGGDWRNRAYEGMQCWAYDSFDVMVAVSRKLAADLERRRIPRRRIEVVPNAFGAETLPCPAAEARRRLLIPDGVFSIGWVGRTTPEKGLDVFIEALGALRDLPFHATVVGDGSQRAAAEQRAAALGIASALGWAGVVTAAGRLMPAFDVLVNSSRTDVTPSGNAIIS